MRYYPIHLDLRGRPCLVVGGGAVGTRKVQRLVGCGARVTVVSPEVSDTLARLAQAGGIDWRRRPYDPADLEGAFLVIGATDDGPLNARIGQEARRRGLLVNLVDRPEGSTFLVPSVVERGDLVIGISTGGSSPALAKRLRRELEGQFGAEYARLLELLGAVRRRLLAGGHDPESHRRSFEALLESDLLEWIRGGDTAAIDRRLAEVLGEGYDCATLLDETG